MRCGVIHDGRISPDFFGWVVPHGDKAAAGMRKEDGAVDRRKATTHVRAMMGLTDGETIRLGW